MKVKTESGKCDFCGWHEAQFTINGGLWWICKECMDSQYNGCTCTQDLQLIHSGDCKYFAHQDIHPVVGEEE